MSFRIGGELEITPAHLAAPQCEEKPTLPKRHLAWVDTGRSALYLALLEVIRNGGLRKAWVPAYICASVIETFRELEFELHFYSMGSNLSDPRFPHAIKKDEVFFYAHYFGRKNSSAVEWLVQTNYAGNFFVIEDCVQASLNADIGSVSDFAITSYRKFLPQPDGALLGANIPIEPKLLEPDETFISAKFLGKLLRQHPDQEKLYLPVFDEAENLLEQGRKPHRMSWLSTYLMDRTDIRAISKTRCENWHALLYLVRDSRLADRALSPIFDRLDAGEIPLGFPIKIHDGKRDALRRYLAEHQIYCPIHWELPHLLDGSEWPSEIELSRAILTLPIDQRLGKDQLNYMIQKIEAFFCESF